MKRKRGRPSAASLAAALLGKLGGLKGGPARAAALTPERLSEIGAMGASEGGKARAAALTPARRRAIARAAAAARWGKEQRA